MFRPTGFNDLIGRRVGIYGYGVEGHAARARLLDVAGALVIVDDTLDEPGVLPTNAGGLEALASCDVVLKSPGISPHSPTVSALRERGVYVTSALNLWLTPAIRNRVIGVTGTKGKSTTTSLITFFLEAVGETATAVGNIGLAPYDPSLDDSTGWLVLEMSSFQCVDLDNAPSSIVLTALGSDHLDWHGSLEQYRQDKLSITRAAGEHVTFVADSPTLREYQTSIGGDVRFVAATPDPLTAALHLLGDHSQSNVALALAVTSHVTGLSPADVHQRVLDAADSFVPLRGRLTLLGTIDGVRYVDDGLATSSLPTIAALSVFADDPVVLLVGGFDRGVDYTPLAQALAQRTAPTSVVTMGAAGRRIRDALQQVATSCSVTSVETLQEAVSIGQTQTSPGCVVLFSPAAPSFDHYQNWKERSEDFARLVSLAN